MVEWCWSGLFLDDYSMYLTLSWRFKPSLLPWNILHLTWNLSFNWNRKSSPSSSWKWSQLIKQILLLFFFICHILLNIFIPTLFPLMIKLNIDKKCVGCLHLASFQMISMKEININYEIDCDVVVTIMRLKIYWDCRDIIKLLWAYLSYSSKLRDEQIRFVCLIDEWQTYSYERLHLTDQEAILENEFSLQSCYQYSHPRIPLQAVAYLTKINDVHQWKWTLEKTDGFKLFQEHLIVLFAAMKGHINLFSSKSMLSSPSLQLFLTSLACITPKSPPMVNSEMVLK